MLVAKNGRRLDGTLKVAAVVAASGAFPGAFSPKTINWAEASNTAFDAPVGVRRFIDGGVIENLGIQGLVRHFGWYAKEQPRPPHLVIISDASKQSEPQVFGPKVGLLELLERTGDITYEGVTRAWLEKLTGQQDFWRWIATTPIREQYSARTWPQLGLRPPTETPAEVLTVVVPITATELGPVMPDPAICGYDEKAMNEAQKTVAGFSTLKELYADQVEEGFWLGYAMGELYWPAIECAALRAARQVCPIREPLTGPNCLSRADIKPKPTYQ